MICTRIGNTFIRASSHSDIPSFNLPFGEPCGPPDEADIDIILNTGKIDTNISVSSPYFLERGSLRASRKDGRIIWHHPRLGAIIDSNPHSGKIQISLSPDDWLLCTDVFFQLIFPALLAPLASRGHRVIHAAAVVYNGRGIMFTGPTGAGKTTFVLRLAEKGATIISDDIVILNFNKESELTAWGVQDAPRLDKITLSRFPGLKSDERINSNKHVIPEDQFAWTRSSRTTDVLLMRERNSTKENRLISLLSLMYHSTNREDVIQVAGKIENNTNFLEVFSPEEAYRLALTL